MIMICIVLKETGIGITMGKMAIRNGLCETSTGPDAIVALSTRNTELSSVLRLEISAVENCLLKLGTTHAKQCRRMRVISKNMLSLILGTSSL